MGMISHKKEGFDSRPKLAALFFSVWNCDLYDRTLNFFVLNIL